MINTSQNEARPALTSNGRILVFWSFNRADSYGSGDLYISKKDKYGKWSRAKNIGPVINTPFNESFPSFSPDDKYLFFTSNKSGNDDIYWVSTKLFNDIKH